MRWVYSENYSGNYITVAKQEFDERGGIRQLMRIDAIQNGTSGTIVVSKNRNHIE